MDGSFSFGYSDITSGARERRQDAPNTCYLGSFNGMMKIACCWVSTIGLLSCLKIGLLMNCIIACLVQPGSHCHIKKAASMTAPFANMCPGGQFYTGFSQTSNLINGISKSSRFCCLQSHSQSLFRSRKELPVPRSVASLFARLKRKGKKFEQELKYNHSNHRIDCWLPRCSECIGRK